MLNVRNLSLPVPGQPGRLLLDNVSLHLDYGEKLAVLGANGAGKSSLLKCISGETSGYQGDILLDHLSLQHWSPLQKARQLAVMPQKVELAFPFCADQVVALGHAPHGDERAAAEIQRAAMQCTDVWHLRSRSYLSLSGGEQQRVQLARVLTQIWDAPRDAQRRELPRWLLLDECTSALDPAHQHSMMERVDEFAQRGVAVLAVLHDIGLAASWADRVVILRDGRVLASGEVELLSHAELLAEAYRMPLALARRYAHQNQNWMRA